MRGSAEQMSEVILDLIRKVPFTNALKSRRALGHMVPKALGGNCVYQAEEAARALNVFPGGVWFLREIIKRNLKEGMKTIPSHHYALLKQTEEGLWFVDLALLHTQVINVTRVLETGEESYPAYPWIHGIPATVRARRLSDGHLHVQREVHEGNQYAIYNSFEFDISQGTTVLPSEVNSQTAQLNHSKYMIRYVSNNKVISLVYNSREDSTYCLEEGPDGIGNWHFGEKGFRQRLDQMAQELGQTVEGLLLTLWDAPSYREELVNYIACPPLSVAQEVVRAAV